MTRKITVSQGFDLARYGSVTLEWTDSSGTYSVTRSTGRFAHVQTDATLSHPSTTPLVSVTVANPYTLFAEELDTAMNNDTASTHTFTVTWSPATNRYTIAVDSGTIAVVWSGAAQVRMRDLLGFSASLPAAASHTSTLCPRFSIEPSIAYMTGWIDFVAQPDRVAMGQTDGGGLTTLRPNLIPFRTAWSHEYEPIDQAHRHSQAVADSPLWTWSDMWMEGAGHGEWVFFCEYAASPHPSLDRRFAFQIANANFDDSTVRQTSKSLRDYFTIKIDALLRGYA